MQKHQMNLYHEPFTQIKNQAKTIELRLNDDKRKAIKENDLIEFKNLKTKEKLIKSVYKIHHYADFYQMYENIHPSVMGYQVGEKANPTDMHQYYTQENILKYGVIGIELIDPTPFKHLETSDLKTSEITLKVNQLTSYIKEKDYVPAYLFDIILNQTQEVIGKCSLRIGYKTILYYGGHIGYQIDEPYRGNNYAKKASLLLFELAKKHQMPYLIITCNPENIASKKTLEKLNGQWIEAIDTPIDSELYQDGTKAVDIFYYSLKEKV